jgi:hypothetical protein
MSGISCNRDIREGRRVSEQWAWTFVYEGDCGGGHAAFNRRSVTSGTVVNLEGGEDYLHRRSLGKSPSPGFVLIMTGPGGLPHTLQYLL